MRLLLIFLALSLWPLTLFADWRTNAAGWTGGPFVKFCGDSITEGYTNWTTFLDGGPSGNTNGDVANWLTRVSGVTATNLAKSGRTWAQLITDELPSVTNNHTKYCWTMCGVNNLTNSPTTQAGVQIIWTNNISQNLNIFASALAQSNITLVLTELLPSSSLNAAKQWLNDYMFEWTTTNTTGVTVYFHRLYTNMASSDVSIRRAIDTWDSTHSTPQGAYAYATNVVAGMQTMDPSYVSPPTACPVLGDCALPDGGGGYKILGDSSAHSWLSFMWTCTNTAPSYQITVVLRKLGNPLSGTVTGYVYTNSASKPGTLLATGNAIAKANLNQYATWTTNSFYITNNFINGGIYHGVLHDDTPDASNYVGLQQSTDGSKNMCYSSDGATWTSQFSANAMFMVWCSPCSGQTAIASSGTTLSAGTTLR